MFWGPHRGIKGTSREMKGPQISLERLREEFHKRSWECMLPDPADTPEVRADKRDRMARLLEIKELELASLQVSNVGDGHVHGGHSDGELAEIAETPVQVRGLSRVADAETLGLHSSQEKKNTGRVSLGGLEQARVLTLERNCERGELDRWHPHLAAAGCFGGGRGGGGGGDSTTKKLLRTNPRAQAIMNEDQTPITRRRAGRESLSRALLLRRGGLDTPVTIGATNTPGDTIGTIYSNGTPGVYIPSMRERMVDVTGTELAEDMAGNLVAGIFATSDPCSLEDSRGNFEAENNEHEAGPNHRGTILESQIENHTDEGSLGRPAEQLDRIPFATGSGDNLLSFLMRFPEYCMYGRATRSGKHVAILLGSLIDKEPKEIVVLSLENDIRVSLVVGVQRSRRYFPTAIPFNVNFFDLAETSKGDPVLLISCAFDLTDLDTQDFGDDSDTKLRVLVRGKEAVAVESDQPIIFVEAFGDRGEVVVTGAYADQGARVMKFDPLWQSFTWKRDYDFIPPEGRDESIVTHISKLLVLEDARVAGVAQVAGLDLPDPHKCPPQPSIRAVLASDFTSEDIVYTFGRDNSLFECIQNAEAFVDGASWRWFLVHKKKIAELGFAGDNRGALGQEGHGSGTGAEIGSPRDLSEEIKPGRKEPRTFTAIFASESYVAAGDIHGTVTVWDVRDRARGKVSCKRFSIAVFEHTKVTTIALVNAKDQDALVVMGSSGVCLLISLPELFDIS